MPTASQELSIAEIETSRQNPAFPLGPGPKNEPRTPKLTSLTLKIKTFIITHRVTNGAPTNGALREQFSELQLQLQQQQQQLMIE